MREVILRLVDVPIERMLVLAGFIFIMIGILGKIEGKIEPGTVGRISAAIFGVILLAIGISMQYTEVQYAELHDELSKAQLYRTAALTQHVAASSPASAVPDAETVAIRVVSGSYGRNCNGKAGNATALLAKACDGHASCDFAINTTAPEDPSPNCSKDFGAEWKCGNGNAVYSATLSGLSGKNDKLHLNCSN